ncbi:interleukin-27 subunit beta [Brachionichthys hirsutus]|uniref:interleukin-27 subunit beta n=1 Tax=Brachionichthys hirsutus TaxID=412623 RepID=UPI0036050786
MVGGVCVAAALLVCVGASSGSPPSAPEVRCWCSSYPNVTLCSWPEPPHAPRARYTATYSERRTHPVTRQCRLLPPGSSSSVLTPASSSSPEQRWHCHLPYLKILTDYVINVTEVHPGGSSSHLSSFTLEDIVKPDPPADLRVSASKVRNLLLEWSPPPTWANLDILPLKYHVLYRWTSRGTPNSVHIGPLEMTSVELKGLTRGRTYLFQVCAKELLDLGECSDWSSAVEITIPRTKL